MSRLPHYRILPKDYGNDVNFTQNYIQWCWVTELYTVGVGLHVATISGRVRHFDRKGFRQLQN